MSFVKHVSLLHALLGLLLAAWAQAPVACAAQEQNTADTETKTKLILDADTANEIDDLYAIARTLKQDKFELLALNSAQWIHYLGQQDSVQASQKLNEDLVRIMGVKDLPLPLGSTEPFGKPWGGEDPKDSAAAQFIIKSARELAEGERMIVACIGASTNLATALKLAPEITPKIQAYILGGQYDWSKGVWNKSEFNVRRDLNAFDFLLNQKELELHVMPTSVSKDLVFEQADSFARQAQMGELGAYLTERWKARFPDNKTWIMWDVTVIEALLDPSLATEEQVTTPPENVERKVWVYKTIKAQEMQKLFWQAVQ